MNRRQLFAALAALPFVGKIAPRMEASPAEKFVLLGDFVDPRIGRDPGVIPTNVRMTSLSFLKIPQESASYSYTYPYYDLNGDCKVCRITGTGIEWDIE